MTVTGGSHAIAANVTLAGNLLVTPSAGTTLRVSGNIGEQSAGKTLTLNGFGMLVLSGSDGYAGSTTVTAGTLKLSNSLALQNSTLTPSGGTIAFDPAVATHAFTLGGLSGGGNVALTDGSNPVTLNVGNNNASTSYGGSLSGSGALTKVGTGSLTLVGANTYSGLTTVTLGALVGGASNALSSNSAVTVTGGTLDVSGFAQTIKSLNLGSGGYLDLSLGKLLTSLGTAGLAGTLNVLNFTSGTAELMAYNAESGTFGTVNGVPGGYQLAYRATELDIIASSGSVASATWATATSGSWNDLTKWSGGVVPNGAGQQAVVGAATSASWTITLDSPQTLGILTFANSASNTAGYTLAAGTAGSLTMNNSGSTAQMNVTGGSHAISANITLAGNLAVAASAGTTLLISGSVNEQNAGMSLSVGGGTLVLAAANTFTGPTTLKGGRLVLSNGLALQDSTLTPSGGTVAFDPAVAAHSFTLGGLSGTGNIALTDLSGNPVTLSAGNNNANTSYSGILSGSGGLTKIGTGSLTLMTYLNSYSGATTISGGTLALASGVALLNSTIYMSGTGALGFGSLTSGTLGGLAGPGSLALTNAASAGVALSVGHNGVNTTYSGVLSGSGGLSKVGAGSLTFTGSNTYSGATTVTAGGLVAGAAYTLSPNSALTLSAGTLDVSGFAQTVKSLNLGSTGFLNLAAGNLLTSTGSATLAGTLNVLNTSGGTRELLAYGAESGAFGTVNGVPLGYQLVYRPTELDIGIGPAAWITASSGSWTDGTKWSGGASPSGSGQQAVVGAGTSAP